MERNFEPEFVFNVSRSSGPGGQNVNKVNTKAELRFDIKNSSLLSDDEKLLITKNLEKKLTLDGILIITSSETRSLLQNKENCISKFYAIIEKALIVPKIRKKSRPSKAWHQERLNEKKLISEKKQNRKKDF